MKKDDCIFCKLANGIIPTNSLYEDDIVNVIFDANPASEGHVLILPKEHFDNIYSLDDKTAAHVFQVAVKVANAINDSLHPRRLWRPLTQAALRAMCWLVITSSSTNSTSSSLNLPAGLRSTTTTIRTCRTTGGCLLPMPTGVRTTMFRCLPITGLTRATSTPPYICCSSTCRH